MTLDVISGDRRLEKRYEFQSPIRFHYAEGPVMLEGWGRTLDFSREAIRFESDTPPPVGAHLEAEIAWPFLLQGVCHLELIVRGQVLSVSGRGVILTICSHEFRTCGERSFTVEGTALGESRVA